MIPEDLAYNLVARARLRAGEQLNSPQTDEENEIQEQAANELLGYHGIRTALEEACQSINSVEQKIDILIKSKFNL